MQNNRYPFLVAATFILMSPVAAVASNGGCPSGKEGPTPFTPITERSGLINVHVAAEMPLSEEAINDPGWRFRARTVTISPGATIPIHSHDQRPETVTMKHGALMIYETDCTVGYSMQEGEIYQSGHGKSHWAVNETDDYAVMYVVDLVKTDSFPNDDTSHEHE
ncbi:cupin domain-containing protein [Halomonas cupida]|uniref:cupin domain-containing protein n=1 Tax=Halomonas cupida TaxID=44933 RepID=UPI003A902AB4